MNVTIRPLAWVTHTVDGSPSPRYTVLAMGESFCVERMYFLDRFVGWGWHGTTGGPREGSFDTAELAMRAVERWHTAKVLDCLEPADSATAAEFVTILSQCNMEYDG